MGFFAFLSLVAKGALSRYSCPEVFLELHSVQQRMIKKTGCSFTHTDFGITNFRSS